MGDSSSATLFSFIIDPGLGEAIGTRQLRQSKAPDCSPYILVLKGHNIRLLTGGTVIYDMEDQNKSGKSKLMLQEYVQIH